MSYGSKKKHRNDPRGRKGHGTHHDQRVRERLVERGHDHTHHDERQGDADQEPAEGLLLLLIIGSEREGEIRRDRLSPSARPRDAGGGAAAAFGKGRYILLNREEALILEEKSLAQTGQ